MELVHHGFSGVGGGGVNPGEQRKECGGKCLWEPHEIPPPTLLLILLSETRAATPVYTPLGMAAWASLRKCTRDVTHIINVLASSCKCAPNTPTQNACGLNSEQLVTTLHQPVRFVQSKLHKKGNV